MLKYFGWLCLVVVVGWGGWWGFDAIKHVGDGPATIGMCDKETGEKAETCKKNAKADPKTPDTVVKAINEPN